MLTYAAVVMHLFSYAINTYHKFTSECFMIRIVEFAEDIWICPNGDQLSLSRLKLIERVYRNIIRVISYKIILSPIYDIVHSAYLKCM